MESFTNQQSDESRQAHGTKGTSGREKGRGLLRQSVAIFAVLFLLVLVGSFWSTYDYLTKLVLESITSVESFSVVNSTYAKEPSLPLAAQPVTFFGRCGNADDKCVDVHFTENACNNSIYPFRSVEERNTYKSWFYNHDAVAEKYEHRMRCQTLQQETPDRIHGRNGSVPWCQKDSTNFNVTNIPIGCTMFSHGGRSGAFQGMMLFPRGKLAFCGIPKTGITQWLHFLRFTFGAKDYQSMPHYKKDRENFLFDRYNIRAQESILNDESWTKAIFIRDPAQRLLSAYLDKVYRRNPQKYWPWYNRTDPPSFADFVDILSMSNATCPMLSQMGEMSHPGSGLNWCSDPHWRPQVYSCAIYETLPNFAFVGSLENAGPTTKALLESVNMWESYGKHYRTDKRTRGGICSKFPPSPLQPGQVALGFQQKPHNNSGSHNVGDTHGHNKDAKSKMEEYYTDDLLKKVKEIYAMDYGLYDVLQNEFGGSAHGKDLARALNPACL